MPPAIPPHILVDRRDGVAIATSNRARERNPLGLGFPDEFLRILDGLENGLGLHAAVLIGSERAKYFFAFGRLGAAACDMGCAYLLPKIVGTIRARHWLLTGAIIEAEQGKAAGLFVDVVPSDQLLPAALEIATAIKVATPRRAPAASKLAIVLGEKVDLQTCISYETYVQTYLFSTDDHKSRLRTLMNQQNRKWGLNDTRRSLSGAVQCHAALQQVVDLRLHHRSAVIAGASPQRHRGSVITLKHGQIRSTYLTLVRYALQRPGRHLLAPCRPTSVCDGFRSIAQAIIAHSIFVVGPSQPCQTADNHFTDWSSHASIH